MSYNFGVPVLSVIYLDIIGCSMMSILLTKSCHLVWNRRGTNRAILMKAVPQCQLRSRKSTSDWQVSKCYQPLHRTVELALLISIIEIYIVEPHHLHVLIPSAQISQY